MVKSLRQKGKNIKITVYVIPKYGDEFLLLHRTEDVNVWEFPGGKIEFGENPIETAKRELQEETGIKGKNMKLLDILSVLYPNGKTMQICIFYLMEVPKKVSPFLSAHKEFKWVKLKDAFRLNLALSAFSILKKMKENAK